MSVDLREAGLRCVEKIVSWVLAVSINATSPAPFIWNGQDYLLKMYSDLDFVKATIGPSATKIANFCMGNPLLLSREEIAGKGAKSQVGRAHAASIVILDVIRRTRAASDDGASVAEANKKKKAAAASSKQPRKKVVVTEAAHEVVQEDDEIPEDCDDDDVKDTKGNRKVDEERGEEKKDEGGSGSALVRERLPTDIEEEPAQQPSSLEEDEVVEDADVIDASAQEETDESYGDDYDDFEDEEESADQVPRSNNQLGEEDIEEVVESTAGDEGNDMNVTSSPISDNMLKQYEINKLLGEGAYGYVYAAKKKSTSGSVAIKKFKSTDEDDEDVDYIIKTQEREVDICAKLAHERVVRLLDSFTQDGTQYLVFEMMQCTVLQLIERNSAGVGNAHTVQSLTRQMLEGLAFCHKNNVVHRDVKPENLLLNDSNTSSPVLKICDFGAARYLDAESGRRRTDERGGLTNYVGSRCVSSLRLLYSSLYSLLYTYYASCTHANRARVKRGKEVPPNPPACQFTGLTSRWYRAPELLGNNTSYGFAVDIWSAACIMAELVTGSALFQGNDEKEIMQGILDILGPVQMPMLREFQQRELVDDVYAISRASSSKELRSEVKQLNEAGLELLERMLSVDAASRPAAEACIESKYLLSSPEMSAQETEEEEENGGEYGEEEFEFEDDEDDEDDGQGQGEEEEVDGGAAQGARKETRGLTDDSPCFEMGSRRLAKALKETVLRNDPGSLGSCLAEATVFNFEAFVGEVAARATTRQVQSLIEGIQSSLDSACASRVESCKVWMLSEQRSDMTLIEVVEAAKENVGSQEKVWTESNIVAMMGLQKLSTCIEGSNDLLPSLLQNHSVNSLLSLVSALLLDTEVSHSSKLAGLAGLAKLLGLPPLTECMSVLSPTNKGLFLYMEITKLGASRLTLTTFRENSLETCRKLLEHAGYLESEVDDRSFVICPYYRSNYGRKISEGYSVEEGEGLGPRKELFALISEQFLQKHKRAADASFNGCAGEKGHSTIRLGANWEAHVDAVKPGCMVVVNEGDVCEQRRTVTRVNGWKGEIMLDKILTCEFENSTVQLFEVCTPLLTWKKDCEKVWVNQMCQKTGDNELMFQLLGVLMGLTVVNQCHLVFSLPSIFFKLLMDKGYVCTKDDLAGFDDSMLNNLQMVEKTWSSRQIREVCEVEGLTVSADDSKDDLYKIYERHLLRNLLDDNVRWQMDAIRMGFLSMVREDELQMFKITSDDLNEIVCGPKQDVDANFDFREVFQVVCDEELSSCRELHDALWEVIECFSVRQKRQLLLFITGIDRLPAKGTEFLTIGKQALFCIRAATVIYDFHSDWSCI